MVDISAGAPKAICPLVEPFEELGLGMVGSRWYSGTLVRCVASGGLGRCFVGAEPKDSWTDGYKIFSHVYKKLPKSTQTLW